MLTKTAFVSLIAIMSLCTVAGAVSLKPDGYIRQWTVLGPFANPERPATQQDRGAFDIDYLKPVGGEAKAKIAADTTIGDVRAKSITLSGDLLDFTAQYKETDHKLAYAYTELESASDQEVLFFLGSDDAVKVWVNGKLAHENFIQRPAVVRNDRFKVKLRKGMNAILAKVENGTGGWGLIVEAYAGSKAAEIMAEIQTAENSKAFQRQELGLANGWPGYAFWPEWGGLPKIIWRDVDEVRRLVGDVPLKVRWFDAQLNEVKAPDKPGRYAAYIEAKLEDGTPIRRAMTFFCDQEGRALFDDWVNPERQLDVSYPGKPVDPQVWEEQKELVIRDMRSLRDVSMWSTQEGAVILAALVGTKPTGRKATITESPRIVNDQFQLDLKLKLLEVAGKTRPLAPPMQLDKPTPVLHQGTLAEAGMKPDAKEKIDALCRQWADDSSEPFTILVARNGVIVTHEAFGKKANGTPVGLDYRTDVMSITKAVTGMLFSRFLDQGYVKLDDPIGRRIPGFPTKGEKALTYRHLFTHTNGLEGHGEWGGIHNPHLDNVVLNGMAYIHPGRMLVYNGMGYDLAAKAMEYMTGRNIVSLFHEGLFRPLGINDVPVDDCAFGAYLTSYELGILGQVLANHGSYGDKQLISEETFQSIVPQNLEKYYPAVKADWGIGLTWMPEHRPGAPFMSLDPKDLIFSPHTVGHGSASSCILRADYDRNLVIAQIRHTAGPKYAEYAQKFFETIAEELR